MKYFPTLLASLLLFASFTGSAAADWLLRSGKGTKLLKDQKISGSVNLYLTGGDRKLFRPDPVKFNAESFDVTVTANGCDLKGWLFVADKDGVWFQSEKEFLLKDGKKTVLSVPLQAPGRNWLPSGHTESWSGRIRSAIYEYGLTLCPADPDDSDTPYTLTAEDPVFPQKKADGTPLEIIDWQLPAEMTQNVMVESRFNLNREYFNPFDPDEIEVDFEIDDSKAEKRPVPVAKRFHVSDILPRVTKTLLPWEERPMAELELQYEKTLEKPEFQRYPAFYGQDFLRRMHFTEEITEAVGLPYWAFRYLPKHPGEVRLRLRVHDKTTGDILYSPFRTVTVKASDARGPVHVSHKNSMYFQFANGDFYYPVSMNIHANTDRRSESIFKWGMLPDRGTADYEDYLNACGKAGISMAEIWMASWTYAIEWDSARKGYGGNGRYSLANAWRMDRVMQLAQKNGIYVNLVLDSHGKLSSSSDQEWGDHPLNARGTFAKANDAILDDAEKFWSDFKAWVSNSKRNRYIAARWGADPHVFAIEYWSEVDLVKNGSGLYRRGWLQFWHGQAYLDIMPKLQAVTLHTTHVCGVGDSTHHYREICIDPPEFTHVVSDAYRSPGIHMADQLRRHTRVLSYGGKPMVVTEFGGTSGGSSQQMLKGDVHSALWGALFSGQGGTPALWWHDFVHKRDLYHHYAAFARYMEGLDLLLEKPVFGYRKTTLAGPRYQGFAHQLKPVDLSEDIIRRAAPAPSAFFHPFTYGDAIAHSWMTLGDSTYCAWLYRHEQTRVLPESLDELPWVTGQVIDFPVELRHGDYAVSVYDTFTGDVTHTQLIRHDGSIRKVALPPFRLDTALKIRRIMSK